jgi:Tfp pilus assembly protein PilF
MTFYERGNTHLTKKDYDHAIADHNKAILLDPRYAPALAGRSCAHEAKGNHDRAKTDYNEAIPWLPPA